MVIFSTPAPKALSVYTPLISMAIAVSSIMLACSMKRESLSAGKFSSLPSYLI